MFIDCKWVDTRWQWYSRSYQQSSSLNPEAVKFNTSSFHPTDFKGNIFKDTSPRKFCMNPFFSFCVAFSCL